MYEVEVKVEAEHGPVRDELAKHDARRVGAVIQEDTYYNAPHRDFATTDEALRIRRERSIDADKWKTVLTYKGPLVDEQSKTREEVELAIDDFEGIKTILERLGFTPAATVRKEREQYQLEEYLLTLDQVDDVGSFVEIETEVETDIESARETAYDWLTELGLDPDASIRTSYLGMLLADN